MAWIFWLDMETEPRDLTKPLAAFLSYLAAVLLEVDEEDHRNKTSGWLVDHLNYDAASGFYQGALGMGQLSEQDIESLKSIHDLLARAVLIRSLPDHSGLQ